MRVLPTLPSRLRRMGLTSADLKGRSYWPIEYHERIPKKKVGSGNDDKLASAESETQVEDLSEATTSTTSSTSMQTAAAPPTKLEHVIHPRAPSFKDKKKNHLRNKNKKKKLVKAKKAN